MLSAGLILVMPEGNRLLLHKLSRRSREDRYEDYIGEMTPTLNNELLPHPITAHRAIVGVSMGGLGAVVLSLKHPDLSFRRWPQLGVDVPSRPFSIKRVGQYRQHLQSGSWEPRAVAPVIHLFLFALPIRRRPHISFSPVAIKKVCCPPIHRRHVPVRWISTMSFTPSPVVMTGTSGTAMCLR